ncbi:unnamed protein product, partial [Larinioides sclopetarius]
FNYFAVFVHRIIKEFKPGRLFSIHFPEKVIICFNLFRAQ